MWTGLCSTFTHEVRYADTDDWVRHADGSA